MTENGIGYRERVVLVCLLLGVAGCAPKSVLRKTLGWLAPDADEALAKQCLTDLLAGDVAAVKSQLDPRVIVPGTSSDLAKLVDGLDRRELLSLELVACHVAIVGNKRGCNLSYQCQFPDSWALVTFSISTFNGDRKVYGINIQPLVESLEKTNAFTFARRGVRHYAMLALAVVLLLFSLYALVVCIRTRLKRLKWLWIIFILLGITRLTLNWTTGQMVFNPLALNIPVSSAFRGGLYAPWTINIFLPIGAILFLLLRKRLAAVPSLPAVDENAQPVAPTETSNEPPQS